LKLDKRAIVVSISGESFMEALQKYGASQTLNFLVRASTNGDWVLNELLAIWTSTVSLSEFLKKIPVFEVTPEEFEHWMKSGSFV